MALAEVERALADKHEVEVMKFTRQVFVSHPYLQGETPAEKDFERFPSPDVAQADLSRTTRRLSWLKNIALSSTILLWGGSIGALTYDAMNPSNATIEERGKTIEISGLLLLAGILPIFPAVLSADAQGETEMMTEALSIAQNSNENKVIVTFPRIRKQNS